MEETASWLTSEFDITEREEEEEEEEEEEMEEPRGLMEERLAANSA